MKLAWIIPVFIIFGNAQAKECDDSELSEHRAKAESQLQKIEKWVVTHDISEDIVKYENTISECDQLRRELAIATSKKEFWISTGRVAEIERRANEIKYLSNIRDVSPELASYKKLISKDKLKLSEFPAFNEYYRAHGKASQEKAEESCSSVDLSKGFGRVRNQGSNVPWCFAAAAADFLSFKAGKRVSAIHMASKYFEHNQNANGQSKSTIEPNNNYPYQGIQINSTPLHKLSGGSPWSAVDTAIESGLCLQKDVGVPDDEAFELEDFERLDKLWEAAQNDGCKVVQNPANEFLIKKFFPQKNFSDLIAVFRTSEKSNLFDELITKSCNPLTFDKNLKTVTASIQDTELDRRLNDHLWYAEKIDEELNKGNPAMVAYNLGVLGENKLFYGNADHTSNVIGRRYNHEKNRCEYLLRNSWGKSCDYADKSYECKDGQIWIPKDVMAASIQYITYFK